jgi:dTDP-4-dehydrorhamnose reductase
VRRTRHRDIVLVTGAHGFLGQHVVRLFLDESRADLVLSARDEKTLFSELADEPRMLNYHQLDVTDRNAVRDVVLAVRPDVIINCAAFVDVDAAETDRERAWRTNVNAVEYLIEAARKVDARIVQISSDYVFDGTKTPYAETATPNPVNYYGRTKLASENALRSSGVEHVILRTGLLYGVEEHHKKNFAMWVIQSLRNGQQIDAYIDLLGSPTLVDDAALATVRLAESRKQGIYHLAGSEMISRYDFAVRIATNFRFDASRIAAVPFDATKHAERPRKSSFVTLKAQTELGIRPTGIDEGLQVMYRGLQDLANPTRSVVYM